MLFLPPYPSLENKEPALKGRHLSCKPEDGLKTCPGRVREGRDGKQQPKELLMAEMRSLKALCSNRNNRYGMWQALKAVEKFGQDSSQEAAGMSGNKVLNSKEKKSKQTPSHKWDAGASRA